MILQTFGDVIDKLPDNYEYLVIEFSPSTVPINQLWRNNGISADFIGNYITSFFTNDDEVKQNKIRETVSYITNELLENSMKFYDQNSHCPIDIQIKWCNESLQFIVTNSIPNKAIAAFQAYLKTLINTDPQELWMEKLVNRTDEENGSELGLLTMRLYYEAKLRWTFETLEKEPAVIVVTTTVQLTI